MNKGVGMTSMTAAALLAATACGTALAGGPTPGPDVTAGDITGPSTWGVVGNIGAYSIGTTSCNLGTTDLLWDDETFDGTPANLHPVISQNMFRLKDGRFEQIGIGWLKHSFFALEFNGLCQPLGVSNCQPAFQGGNALGPGCHDPYSSGLNGDQSGLGPRFEITPASGAYPWPYTARGQRGNTIYKRIQVDQADMDPAQNAGALYFGEGQYVTPDEAPVPASRNNNASYRRMVISGQQNGAWRPVFTGGTATGRPAIQAWQDFDPTVGLDFIDVPNDGRLIVGFNAYDNGDGTWRYEYAIQNLNSDRSGGSFSVPVPSSVTVTDLGFKDVDYHSGEPYSNQDWSAQRTTDAVVWSSPFTEAQNPLTNALRWGTLYNFSFTADAAPVDVTGELGLFKAGTPGSMSVATIAPEGASCPLDFTGDGELAFDDVLGFLTAFNGSDPAADLDGDGSYTFADVLVFTGNFSAGCP